MLCAGIDTHLRIHRIEIQNDIGSAMWKGQIRNDRKGFEGLLEKFRTIEKSNSQSISAVFMNPTGNYHAPLKAFLESNDFRVILVEARISEHIRMMLNLGREKSDSADASVLAATARMKPSIVDTGSHERSALLGIARMMESVKKNITRLIIQIKSDLAAVFPEYPFYDDVDSRTSLEILMKYATPASVTSATLQDILATMRISSKNHYGEEHARKLIDLARESIGIPDTDGVYAYRISMNVQRLKDEKGRLREIEEEVKKRSSGNQDVSNISEIRGMGEMNASTIVYEIGDIRQFSSSVKLQAYGGKAPDISGSGGSTHATGVTRIRNPHLSSAIYESAVSLVANRSPEFSEIFAREIRKGKKPTQAYIVVGKRLLYHVYSIMKNHKQYRERLPLMEGTVSTQTSL